MFNDRVEAGLKLSEELMKYKNDDCIILGIPRGGAIIAKVVAERLKKPWDIIVTRKIGAPFNKEVAIGAITQDGYCMLNDGLIMHYNISSKYIEEEKRVQLDEIKRRLTEYRGSIDFPNIRNKIVIITDDGLATGFTFLAAVESIKKHTVASVVAAVPVAPASAIDMIGKHVNEVICLEIPKEFLGVGQSYKNFEQNSDDEIIALFKQYNSSTFV